MVQHRIVVSDVALFARDSSEVHHDPRDPAPGSSCRSLSTNAPGASEAVRANATPTAICWSRPRTESPNGSDLPIRFGRSVDTHGPIFANDGLTRGEVPWLLLIA